mmetsp:Transcript_11156/g.18735  ORF Transcript_11156/g.18735 Transcript_11156/m.18735 type:complete len:81 (+) Transcript_11156:274-516(+)
MNQAYMEVIEKVKRGQELSSVERKFIGHDYVQRYCKELMNEQEERQFRNNMMIGHFSGLGLALFFPLNVVLFFQRKYNPS